VAPSGPGWSAADHANLPVETPRRLNGRTLLLVLWAAGALIIIARLAVGTTLVASLARRGARVEDGGWLSLAQRLSSSLQIDRPLTLLRGDRVGVPITWGIVYPVVLLPDDADAWPEERRRFVLVHEMAHVKRLDALTQLAGQLALALFWFDPLVWVANRRMQLEREHACDDYVLRHGTSASHYAEELLAMVRSLGTAGHRGAQPAFAALAMARRSEFEGRMLSILDPVLDRHPLSKGRTLMSALAALLLVVPLAALHPYERSTPHGTSLTGTPAAVPTFTLSLPAGTDSALPESFKINIHSAGDAAAALKQGAASAPSTPSLPSQPSLPSRPSPVIGMVASPASPTSPSSPTSPKSPTSSAKATTSPKSCDDVAVPGTTINALHENDDDQGERTFRYFSLRENGDCLEATLVGTVTFTDAEDDIASMPVTSHAVFRERRGDDRELVVRWSENGSLAHILRLNGRPAPYDDAARRWLAGFLPTVLREGAINVKPRVSKLMAAGGVDAVLRMIGTINSSGSKRAHYEALLEGGRLSSDDLDRIVRHAGRNLSSSGDLRAVLTQAGPGVRNNSRTSNAFEEAVNAVSSSGDKRAVLEVYGQSTDRGMLLSVMRMAETVASSGDRTYLLTTLAPNYLGRNDDALREAYFRAAAGIPSSGDLRRVLNGAVNAFGGDEKVAYDVAVAASGVPSSGDRAAVLTALANVGALRSTRVRDAYMRAAQGLSSGDAVRVLQAAARDR
jgi:beta-lactamase regulating signal transducer with metallopeptidase domain